MSLGTIVMQAVAERELLKARGFAGPELDAAFEKIVRDAWPKGREWFYICTACDDSGWEWRECPGDSTCGPSTRQVAANMPCRNEPRETPHGAHRYVRVCFCEKGQKLRSTISNSEDFSSATKAKPKKQFSKWGTE